MAKEKEKDMIAEPAVAEAEKAEPIAEQDGETNAPIAEEKKEEERVSYMLPMNVLSESDTVEACVNGKVYQIRCGEQVMIPKSLAEVLDHAVEQTKKVNKMMKEREQRSMEIV